MSDVIEEQDPLVADDLNPFFSFQPFRLHEDVSIDNLIASLQGNLRTIIEREPQRGGERKGITASEVVLIPEAEEYGWKMLGAVWSVRRAVSWLEEAPIAPPPPTEEQEESEEQRVRREETLARIERVKQLEDKFEQVSWNLLLVAMSVNGERPNVAFHCTDGSVRNGLKQFLLTGSYGELIHRKRMVKPLPKKVLETVCLEGNARQASLTGLHREVTTRANAKSLHGSRLQDAIDPFDDQTFRLDSAVSVSDTRTPSFIGVALRNNQVWSTRGKAILDFAQQLTAFFAAVDHAENAPKPDEPVGLKQHGFNTLAVDAEAGELDKAHTPVDVSFRPVLRTIEELTEHEGFERFREKENTWFDGGSVIMEEQEGVEQREVTFLVSRNGRDLMRMTVKPVKDENSYRLTVERTSKLVDDDQDEDLELFNELCAGDNLTRRLAIWYATGHVLQDGTLSILKYQDVLFDAGWDWRSYRIGTTQYDVTAEKPVRDNATNTGKVAALERIGEDRSIFCYLLHDARNIMGLKDDEGPLWAICDDGSGEIADFIYFAPEVRKLWLIHAKGAHVRLTSKERQADHADELLARKLQNRGLSVSAYETVVGQATKNLRYTDARMLAEGLAGRQPQHIWKDGERMDPAQALREIIADLQARPFLYERALVIAQPHVRSSAWDEARAQAAIEGATSETAKVYKLLSALLADAQIAAQKNGLRFIVLGQKG